MSFADITEAIRAKFRTDVTEPNELRVVHSNEPPQGNVARWCQMHVEVQSTAQVSTGTIARFRVTGRVLVTMFCRIADGDAWLLQTTDLLTAAFRGAVIQSPAITFGPPTPIGPSSRDEAGGYWRLPTQILFRADVFGTIS